MINEEPSNPGRFRMPNKSTPSEAGDPWAPSDVRALARFFELLDRWAHSGPANDDVERDD